MLKRYWYKADWTLLVPVFILLLIGIVMMFSTSAIIGFSNYNDSYFFIKRHFVYLLLGMGAFVVGFLVPHDVYRQKFSWLAVAMVGMLLLTLSPMGVSIGGAQRWLDLGVLRFQPAEVAKFVVVIFVAMALDRPVKALKNFVKGCLFILVLVAMPLVLLVLQPDLGNTALILGVVFVLLFLSRVPLGQLAFLGGISSLSVAAVIASHAYQRARIMAFLNPWADPMGKNYHMVQSLIAVGSGGLFGVGLGESKLKYFYLPLQYSDFIFAIICEEGGFLLAMFVLLMYVFILMKSYYIAQRTESRYSFYVGMGCALMICLQAFLNMGVVVGLLPVTGIPLTFISFGGTSLITSLFYMGVILNISNVVELKQYEVSG